MSLRIVKTGIMDSLQDAGRYGYQHLGINPGGAADPAGMYVANVLVGNRPEAGILEMHFPAADICFKKDTLIALSGADFCPRINNLAIDNNRPLLVRRGNLLKFTRALKGSRVYLAVHGGFDVAPWLGSVSTNLKAAAGGYGGRALKSNDLIGFNQSRDYSRVVGGEEPLLLPWKANTTDLYPAGALRVIPGNEYPLLVVGSQRLLNEANFKITTQSDRMGYRLSGEVLKLNRQVELISSGVSTGTMQLLPNGQVIVLMADHQTTGGYPRIGHVIMTDIARLAQMKAGEDVSFELTDIAAAEKIDYDHHLILLQLQHACEFRLEKWLA